MRRDGVRWRPWRNRLALSAGLLYAVGCSVQSGAETRAVDRLAAIPLETILEDAGAYLAPGLSVSRRGGTTVTSRHEVLTVMAAAAPESMDTAAASICSGLGRFLGTFGSVLSTVDQPRRIDPGQGRDTILLHLSTSLASTDCALTVSAGGWTGRVAGHVVTSPAGAISIQLVVDEWVS